MRKYLSTIQYKIGAIFFALAVILLLRLFSLTVVQYDDWSDAANDLSIRGIYTQSPRGNIYDRNGNLLAGNQQIFTVKMSAGTMENKEINDVAYELIKIFEKNGDEYNNNLPIKYENGEFYYTYEEDIRKWLEDNNINSNATAEEAFYSLRDNLGIESTDRFEILGEIQNKYGIYPPISVRSMKYTADVQKEMFLAGFKINEDATAEKAFKDLRKYYEIDDEISDAEALKILSIRIELKSMGYKKYLSATIARDVSDETIMEVEENSEVLKGVEVVSETKRYYPNEELASHVLGYLGSISSDEQEKYEKMGYSTSAFIGKQGIEGVYESVLKGQDGTSIIRVDAHGNYVETLQEVETEKGKDVYLTIDAELQKVAEDALKRNIEAAQNGTSFTSEFGNIGLSKAPNAKTGAVVALEVETGDVLAMASYPGYDPNLFAEGISTEDWKSLQSENPRDSLAPSPLYNLATLSAVQPGSTFKPITALAALECGLNPNRQVKDEGYIFYGDRKYGCVAYNLSGSNHGYLDLYKAIQVSCNYYFYDIITNKDWANGGSLGLDGMNTEKVTQLAQEFGLGEKTGIQLPESAGFVPSEEKKINGLQQTLRYVLNANAEIYFTEDVYSNSKRLEKDIETIVSWLKIDDMTYSKMKKEYLPKVGVKEEKYEDLIQLVLYDYINQAEWGVGDAFNISIGQGDNAYTPLQIANYVATLGNDGVKNQVSVVKSIEDEGDIKKDEPTKVNVSEENIEIVKEGMHMVTTGAGSGISHHYSSFPWEVCAKTGTAQKSGRINPVSEVDYIKSHLGSFGNMSWNQVETEMKRLMNEYPETYSSEDIAVRRAVINLSGGKVTSATLDQFKEEYDEFAWTIAMAPKDDPKIAVACVIPQGYTGGNANPVVREIIGQYLKSLDIAEDDFKIVNQIN